MGRVVSIIYGIILIVLSLVLMFAEDTAFGIPSIFFPAFVVVMGILILLTPMETDARRLRNLAMGTPRPAFRWLRRWVFGFFIVISGALPFLQEYIGDFPWGARLSSETFSGQLILLAVGAVYLLASFARTRNIQIRTA